MAAAIKMDELLVSWLGSDNVYENVLKIIEQQRSITSSSSSSSNNNSNASLSDMKTPPDSPSRVKDEEEEKDGNNGVGGSGNEDGKSDASPNSVIPPFYRPATPTSSDSAGGEPQPPPIRRRTYSFSDDQTWDGIYSSNTTDKTNTDAKKEDNSSSTEETETPSEDNNPDATKTEDDTNLPKLCIKDQVKSIFLELGKDPSSEEVPDDEKTEINPKRTLTSENFVRITKDVCNFPTFFNGPLYKRILLLWGTRTPEKEEEKEADAITFEMFKWYWRKEMELYDMSERFFRLLKQPESDFVGRDDFLPYIKELLNDHPGLEFLSNHAEFQEKYAVTVITRIFYTVNKCHSGRITSRQIRRSDLLSAFQQVDEEEDINKVTRYFSYEHFYVLYCRFWELDHDRDYRITREDLLKYGDHSLSHMIVDRIFDAAPRPFEGTSSIEVGNNENGDNNSESKDGGGSNNDASSQKQQNDTNNKNTPVNRDYLSYEDFIFFMLSEEDKANEISVRYWFTCIDVDGDGKLNNMEMRSFYAVQLHRMQCMGHEIVPFEDMLCQMIDMIKPANNDYLVVEDFLQTECAQVSGALFDALFNLNKYLQFEQRDPFMERQKREDEFETDWDRFACIDYNRLAMEEEAREEEAMEIDWVTVDDDEDDGDDFNSLGLGGASEAPF